MNQIELAMQNMLKKAELLQKEHGVERMLREIDKQKTEIVKQQAQKVMEKLNLETAVERTSEIEREFDTLVRVISILDDQVERLTDKIKPVCSPIGDCPPCPEETDEPRSQIGKVIRKQIERVGFINQRIINTIDSIQL